MFDPTTPPRHWRDQAATLKARQARTAKYEARQAILVSRYLELHAELGHYPDSTTRMIKALRVSRRKVVELGRLTGKSLDDARRAARLAGGVKPKAEEQRPGHVLPWNALQLFDTLAAYFEDATLEDPSAGPRETKGEAACVGGKAGQERADVGDGQDLNCAVPPLVQERDEIKGDGVQVHAESDKQRYVNRADARSTWLAWRVFLAAIFGLPKELLAVDQGVADVRGAVSATKGALAMVRTAGTDMPAYPGVPENLREVGAPPGAAAPRELAHVPERLSGSGTPRGAAAPPPLADEQAIYEACTGRTVWPTWQSRLVALIVGRRGGKSYVTAIIGIFLALCRGYQLKLGTRGMVMILAKDKEQAGVIRGYIQAFLKTPPLRGFLEAEPTQKLIELTNGVTIEVRAVSEAGTRGYTVVAVLADEIAFWPTDTTSAKQDKKVLRALRPAMLGVKGSMLVMLSSPYARRGELFEAHEKAFGKNDEQRYFVWQADTLTMRPTDDPDVLDEIRDEYADDPDNARAEYGAQFRQDLESVFNKTTLDAVCGAGVAEHGYREGAGPYRAFVDPSGGSADSYVVAVAHDETTLEAGEPVTTAVLDRVVEWRPPFDPAEVSKAAAEVVKSYGVTLVTGDAYAGEWPRAALKRHGVDYAVADQTRSELYLNLLPQVNSRRVRLLDPAVNPTWRRGVNQLVNLERRVGRSGKDSVDHPPGSHDDVANAVAGALAYRPVTYVQLPAAGLDIGVKSEGPRFTFRS